MVAAASLVLENRGEKSLDEVSVTWRFPHLAHLAIATELVGGDHVYAGAAMPTPPRREVTSTETFDFVSHYIPRLNPRSSISISEPVPTRVTRLEFPLAVKDGNVLARVAYAFEVQLTVSAANCKPRDYQILLEGVCARDMRGLHDLVNAETITQQIDLRERLPFWKFGLLAAQSGEARAVLVYPRLSRLGSAESTMVLAGNGEGDATEVVSYSLASWGDLFRPRKRPTQLGGAVGSR